MAEWKKLAEKYKWLCILTGGMGVILSPFLWPFFLAIIFQSLSLAVPIVAAALIITTIRKEKCDEQKCNDEGEQIENTEKYSAKNASKRTTSEEQKNQTTDYVSERDKEKRASSLNQQPYIGNENNEVEYEAVTWYQMEGKVRIQNMRGKLEKENIQMFSISPEGVCCVRDESRFRRVGVLRAFPYRGVKTLIKCLHKDHIHAVKKGRYLWLSWERSVEK